MFCEVLGYGLPKGTYRLKETFTHWDDRWSVRFPSSGPPPYAPLPVNSETVRDTIRTTYVRTDTDQTGLPLPLSRDV